MNNRKKGPILLPKRFGKKDLVRLLLIGFILWLLYFLVAPKTSHGKALRVVLEKKVSH